MSEGEAEGDKTKSGTKKGGDKKKSGTKKGGYNTVNQGAANGFFADPLKRFPTIGGILIAFSFLQVFDIGDIQDGAGAAKDICEQYAALGGVYATALAYMDCGYFEQLHTGATIQLVGIIFILIFSIVGILITCKCGTDCDMPAKLGNNAPTASLVVMIGLVIGGLLYIIGFIIWNTANEYTIAGASFSLGGYADYSTVDYSGYSGTGYTTTYNIVDWETVSAFYKVTTFLETLLGGFTAIVYGYDIWKQALNDDKTRLLLQSIVPLIVVSIGCFIGYAYISAEIENGETGCVAAGYFFVCVSAIVGLLLSFGIIGSNVNVSMAVGCGLILGGFLCAIGYWAASGGAYATGYNAVLLGLCVVDALDLGLYDHLKTCNANSNNNNNKN